MKIFLVTDKILNAEKVGSLRKLNCYLMGFWAYQKGDIRGNIFSTGKEALEFMEKNFDRYRTHK